MKIKASQLQPEDKFRIGTGKTMTVKDISRYTGKVYVGCYNPRRPSILSDLLILKNNLTVEKL